MKTSLLSPFHQTKRGWICCLLAVSVPLICSASPQEFVVNIISSLQANGEYVLGSTYQEDKTTGKMTVHVDTTEGSKLFNESGQMVESTDKQGNRTVYKDGIPVKTVSPSGKVLNATDVQKQGKNKWIASRDYLGNLTWRRVNAQGDTIERKDEQGNHFRCIQIKDKSGQTKGVTEINQKDGSRTTRFFDPKTGEVYKIIDATGAVILVQYEKDKFGRKQKSIETNTRNGQQTTKWFDENGRETTVIDPDGTRHDFEYRVDGFGHVTESVETVDKKGANGQTQKLVITKQFDAAGRVTAEKDNQGKSVAYQYTLNGEGQPLEIKETETRQQGNQTMTTQRTKKMGQDGRVKSVEEGNTHTEYQYEVDENGNVLATKETKYIYLEGLETGRDQKKQAQAAGQGTTAARGSGAGVQMEQSTRLQYSSQGDLLSRQENKNGKQATVAYAQGVPKETLEVSDQGARYATLTAEGMEKASLDFTGPRPVLGMNETEGPEAGTSRQFVWNQEGENQQIVVGASTQNPDSRNLVAGLTVGRQGPVYTLSDADGAPQMVMDFKGQEFLTDFYLYNQKDKGACYRFKPEQNYLLTNGETPSDQPQADEKKSNNSSSGNANKPQLGQRPLGSHVNNMDQSSRGFGIQQSGGGAKGLMKTGETETTLNKQGKPEVVVRYDAFGPLFGRKKTTRYAYDGQGKLDQTKDTTDLSETVSEYKGSDQVQSSKKEERFGPRLTRHSETKYVYNDQNRLEKSIEQNAMSRRVNAHAMDGTLKATDEENFSGPKLGRQRHTEYVLNKDSGQIISTSTTDQLHSAPSRTIFDPIMGSPLESYEYSAYGATAGRNKTTYFECRPETGKTKRSFSEDGLQHVLSEFDEQGLMVGQESWQRFGARQRSHKKTEVTSDADRGGILKMSSVDDVGNISLTQMDENGMAVSSASWERYGARLKRHSVAAIVNNQDTGVTQGSDSINDLGDRTSTTMDENGLAVASESWNTLGAGLKKHSLTELTVNPETGVTLSSNNVNDLGDRSQTWMDEHGLAYRSESWNALGANLKKHSLGEIETNRDTGITLNTLTENDLGDVAFTTMDENGLATLSESWNSLGARLKRHSTSRMFTDPDTGITRIVGTVNDNNDRTLVHNDANGLTASTEQWNAQGARLKRHSWSTEMEVDQDSGMTLFTKMENQLGDKTLTENDTNGFLSKNEQWNKLGAGSKRHSVSQSLEINADTGMVVSMLMENDMKDLTLTINDQDGLMNFTEQWNAKGAIDKRHSKSLNVEMNYDTGIVKNMLMENDMKDQTYTENDSDGLMAYTEQKNAKGALDKRDSKSLKVEMNYDTGIVMSMMMRNKLGDKTYTRNDENGLMTYTEQWNKLGAHEKRHSVSTEVLVDQDTGITKSMMMQNKLGDKTLTRNDDDGLMTFTAQWNVLGLGKSLYSESKNIEMDYSSGMAKSMLMVNKLGDLTLTENDEDGLMNRTEQWNVLGAIGKRHSFSTGVTMNRRTGMVSDMMMQNDLGDKTYTRNDMDGLMAHTEQWNKMAPRLKQHSRSLTVDMNDDTGIVKSMMMVNDMEERTFTRNNENGLMTHTEQWNKTGPYSKRHSWSLELDMDDFTGIAKSMLMRNDLGDRTRTTNDEQGLMTKTEQWNILGAEGKRDSWSNAVHIDPYSGVVQKMEMENKLHDITLTENDQKGMMKHMDQYNARGVLGKRHSWTEWVSNDPDSGVTKEMQMRNTIGDRTLTVNDGEGFMTSTQQWNRYGAFLKRHSQSTDIDMNYNTGIVKNMTMVNDLGDVTYTENDKHGLMTFTEQFNTLGPLDKRHSWSTYVDMDKYSGIAKSLSMVNTLGDVTNTRNDIDGVMIYTEQRNAQGPLLKRNSHSTRIDTDPITGVVRRMEMVNDNLDKTVTWNNEDGLAQESWVTNSQGPKKARFQKTRMTTDPATGAVHQTNTETSSGPEEDAVVVSKTITVNDPILGTPLFALMENTFGSFRFKLTNYEEVDSHTGSVLRSVVEDGGGKTDNEHGELGITKSVRTNILGAIKEVTTYNTLDGKTGIVVESSSFDRKGHSVSQHTADGNVFFTWRTNDNASFAARESTQVLEWNEYTGAPLSSVSCTYSKTGTLQNTTTKYFDLDGYLEKSDTVDKYGDKSSSRYWNNRRTGLPTYSRTVTDTGVSETWYEGNGLALTAKFTATIGLNNEVKYFYNENLDLVSTETTDERGNVSVAWYNQAGEVTHTHSKSGTSHYDVLANQVDYSDGPGGAHTNYYYSGKYMDRTEATDGEGESSTSWYDHRANGSVNKVQTKDSTITYSNTYNERGFVTYRTESDGKASGDSDFNDYGDQLWSHWSGSIPDQDYGHGVRFFGGGWSSSTEYFYKNDRGDVDHWVTNSSWWGKVSYPEVGTWIPGAVPGTEEYVVISPAHTDKVGGSDSKTDSPKHPPYSDEWVRSHLQGSHETSATPGKDPWAGGIEAAADATQADYHSAYQQKLLAQLALQGIGNELKAFYEPIMQQINAQLVHFSETSDLGALKSILGYSYSDMDTFQAQLSEAKNKERFITEKVDAVYYRFSGTHVDKKVISEKSVNKALWLLGTPARPLQLLNWLRFMLPKAELQGLYRKANTMLHNPDNGEDQLRNLFCSDFTQMIQQIAKTKYGIDLDIRRVEKWIAKAFQSLDFIQDFVEALALTNSSYAKNSGGGQGVSFGGGVASPATSVTLDEELLTASGAAVATAPGQGEEKAREEIILVKQPDDRKKMAAIGFAADDSKAVQGIETPHLAKDTAPTLHLGSFQVYQEEANGLYEAQTQPRTENKKGKAPGTETQGQAVGFAVYKNGWLMQANLPNGYQCRIEYRLNPNRALKEMDVWFSDPSGRKKVYKFDNQGKISEVYAQEGSRMQRLTQEEAENGIQSFMQFVETIPAAQGQRSIVDTKLAPPKEYQKQ